MNTTANIIRFTILGVLWVLLAGYILLHSRPITLYTIFIIAASWIIIFVPVYKKYVKNGNDKNSEEISTESEATSLISSIDSPADLRRLSVDNLPDVCADLRRMLIKELSCNPGHFASSMGAVELTVALHYVFNTPYDRIVWDVGHQAYGHKILTGRRDAFRTNRTFNGLSGFPNPDESEYDTFTAGHASNSISAALGFAIASRLKGESPERHVVAVVGDASISGGLAFEGINNAANTPNNLLIVLNDNDMSIDRNVGSLNNYLAHINTSKSYNSFRFGVYKMMKKLGLVNDRRRGTIMRLNNSLKSVISNEQNLLRVSISATSGPLTAMISKNWSKCSTV